MEVNLRQDCLFFLACYFQLDEKIHDANWLTIKQSYSIGYKFSAIVTKTKSFGIFIRPSTTELECIGLIEIIQPILYREIATELLFSHAQRASVGTEIDCIVCRDRNRQFSLD